MEKVISVRKAAVLALVLMFAFAISAGDCGNARQGTTAVAPPSTPGPADRTPGGQVPGADPAANPTAAKGGTAASITVPNSAYGDLITVAWNGKFEKFMAATGAALNVDGTDVSPPPKGSDPKATAAKQLADAFAAEAGDGVGTHCAKSYAAQPAVADAIEKAIKDPDGKPEKTLKDEIATKVKAELALAKKAHDDAAAAIAEAKKISDDPKKNGIAFQESEGNAAAGNEVTYEILRWLSLALSYIVQSNAHTFQAGALAAGKAAHTTITTLDSAVKAIESWTPTKCNGSTAILEYTDNADAAKSGRAKTVKDNIGTPLLTAAKAYTDIYNAAKK